jgi:hypothetical protein
LAADVITTTGTTAITAIIVTGDGRTVQKAWKWAGPAPAHFFCCTHEAEE